MSTNSRNKLRVFTFMFAALFVAAFGHTQRPTQQRQQTQPLPEAPDPTPQAAQSVLPGEDKPLHAGGSVKPPVILYSVNPEYSEEARKKRIHGNVEVYCWIEKDGTSSHIRVVRGLGYGLDEAAMEALRKYRFKPATQDDKPVKVDLYIDVNFSL